MVVRGDRMGMRGWLSYADEMDCYPCLCVSVVSCGTRGQATAVLQGDQPAQEAAFLATIEHHDLTFSLHKSYCWNGNWDAPGIWTIELLLNKYFFSGQSIESSGWLEQKHGRGWVSGGPEPALLHEDPGAVPGVLPRREVRWPGEDQRPPGGQGGAVHVAGGDLVPQPGLLHPRREWRDQALQPGADDQSP